jgi:type I restriction enzyme, S subunit
MESRIETELGALPQSWRVAPLGEFLSEAQYGTSVKGAATGGVPILRMTNQIDGRISPEKLQYANVSPRERQSFRLRRGDILFNRTNSFELVGRTAIFDLEGDYIFASYLIRLRTNETALDPFF